MRKLTRASWEPVAFVAVVLLFVVFGQSVGWRGVGLLQLAFSVHILRRKEVAVGWEGQKPSFHVRGAIALLLGFVSLGIALMLLLFPEQTVMHLGSQS